MVMWGETGVASNKNTEATVSEIEMKKGKGESIAMQHIILVMDYRMKTPRKKQNRK